MIPFSMLLMAVGIFSAVAFVVGYHFGYHHGFDDAESLETQDGKTQDSREEEWESLTDEGGGE